MNPQAIEQAAADWYQLDGDGQHLVTDPRVREWRHQSLIRAGFTPSQATIVATDANIDVHWLIDLTRNGCPHRTACRIAGLDLPEQAPARTLAAV